MGLPNKISLNKVSLHSVQSYFKSIVSVSNCTCSLFKKKSSAAQNKKVKLVLHDCIETVSKNDFHPCPLCFVVFKAFSICGSDYPACTSGECGIKFCKHFKLRNMAGYSKVHGEAGIHNGPAGCGIKRRWLFRS